MTEVLELLIAERDRLNEAIAILQKGSPRRGRKPRSANTEAAATPGKKRRGQRQMSEEQKQAVSARMKKYWAARKKAKK